MPSIFQSQKEIYCLSWNETPGTLELTTSSFSENPSSKDDNQLEVIRFIPELNQFMPTAFLGGITYPFTKLQYAPLQSKNPNLLATTGDRLRLFEIQGKTLNCTLEVTNSRKSNNTGNDTSPIHRNSPAPMTSFDWNRLNSKYLLTCSVDTTCTLWDLETGQAKTQLIAHDKEVLDVSFSNSVDCFASVGADGSLRMFDLRSLDHSTILFETHDAILDSSSSLKKECLQRTPGTTQSQHQHLGVNKALLKLKWHHMDPCYIATFAHKSSTVHIIDARNPGKALDTLKIPTGAMVTDICWCPYSSSKIVVSGLDDIMYVWNDVTTKSNETPQSFYDVSPYQMNQYSSGYNNSEHSSYHTDGSSSNTTTSNNAARNTSNNITTGSTFGGDGGAINCLAWNPHSSQHLAFGYGSSLHILPV